MSTNIILIALALLTVVSCTTHRTIETRPEAIKIIKIDTVIVKEVTIKKSEETERLIDSCKRENHLLRVEIDKLKKDFKTKKKLSAVREIEEKIEEVQNKFKQISKE